MCSKSITPNDSKFWGKNDSETIQNAINYAEMSGINCIKIPKKNVRADKIVWEITNAILLPSNFTVILSNCHLRLADGVYDNIFRNRNMYSDISCKKAGEQQNIVIKGEGYSILDGGNTNFLFETNRKSIKIANEKAGMRVNNLILLHNVNGFVLENFEVKDQRWWAINCLYCVNGKIFDITSNADNYIPNQDCIDIRQGCSNIIIERITGSSGDDLIALTGLAGEDSGFAVEGIYPHIHDITIRDVIGTSVKQGMVVLRNQDDMELYNVKIENVIHSNLGNNNFKGYVTVRVGENGYFKKFESPIGSTRNIDIKNVIGSTSATVMLGATLKDSTFKNVRADGGYWAILSQGVKIDNVNIDGVYYEQRFFEKQSGPYGLIEDTNALALNAYMRKDDYIKNLRISGYQNESGEKVIKLNPEIENEVYLEGEKL